MSGCRMRGIYSSCTTLKARGSVASVAGVRGEKATRSRIHSYCATQSDLSSSVCRCSSTIFRPSTEFKWCPDRSTQEAPVRTGVSAVGGEARIPDPNRLAQVRRMDTTGRGPVRIDLRAVPVRGLKPD